MVQLAMICVFVAIVGVMAIMYVGDWMIRAVAIATIIGTLLVLSTPLLLINAGIWIPSTIYLLQMLQFVVVGVGVSYCIYRFNHADSYSFW